jgi:kynurenine formamidase
MRIHSFVIGVAFALALFLFAQRHPNQQEESGFHGVLNLTHPAEITSASLKRVSDNPSGQFSIAEQIPRESLIAPLVVLDVRASVTSNPDYQIGVEDIAKWERVYGPVPSSAVVMARTGWDTRWFSPRSYRNPDAKGTLHFPGYSVEAAKFLVEGRRVMGLGIDTPSVDMGASRKLTVEPYTLAHSVYHLENVANLDRTPDHGALVAVAPMKPDARTTVRIFALVR